MVRSLSIRLAGVMGLAAGCGGSEDPGGPTTVLVEGRVISARSQAAIAGAGINIGALLGSDFATTTTASDGSFTVNVESFGCEGTVILVTHPGYQQGTPFPDICPASSRTIELSPEAVTSVITPQDPTTGLGGQVNFQVRVTYFDGTIEDPGEGVWSIVPDGVVDELECGTFPDLGLVHETTYTAPSTPPPAECGADAGQVAITAAPLTALGAASFDASDTVVVTVTP